MSSLDGYVARIARDACKPAADCRESGEIEFAFMGDVRMRV